MLIEKIYSSWNECERKLTTDSRKIIPGGIFFALRGEQFNGNEFAKEALDKGAAYAIIDDEKFAVSKKTILVPDTLTALQELATYHRLTLKNTRFIALTGSNGKTTTKELIRSVLSMKFKVCATRGNLNNHIGVPLTLLNVFGNDAFAVIEMGANHQLEIAELCKIVLPDFGIVTNIGKAHLEGFGGFEGVIKGKGEMYDFLKEHHRSIFLHADNSILLNRCGNYDKLITYGTSEKYFCCGSYTLKDDCIRLTWKTQSGSGIAQSNLSGEYNFENLLAAACIGSYFNLTETEIKIGIESYQPDNQRSQILRTRNSVLILDYYNANPTSMTAAINNLADNFSGKRVAVLGDMLELGNHSEEEHRNIIQLLSQSSIDDVILVGNHFMKLKSLLSKGHFFSTSESAAEYLKKHKPVNSTVLIKGSRGSRMEIAAEVLVAG